MGCDHKLFILINVKMCFNPRTHMGCDCHLLALLILHTRFNPRTHMGCDGCTQIQQRVTPEFQSTHPHGVRHFVSFQSLWKYFVSIHAPTWGATFYRPTDKAQHNVSIHAPTWGATGLSVLIIINPMFQSTHPHGVRHI